MPNYIMSYFRIPNKLEKEISRLMANFWWDETEGEKMHMLRWDKMTEIKEDG